LDLGNLSEFVNQPEGRRLEFKSIIPSSIDLVKTIISFANDAGGNLYIGIQDNPRKIIGLEREGLIEMDFKLEQELQQELQQESLLTRVLNLVQMEDLSRKGISVNLGQKSISGQLNQKIRQLFELGLVERTIEETPQSPKQRLRITQKGKLFLNILNEMRSR
jgi:hypothetical protein